MSAPIESTRTAFETIAHGVSCAVAIHQNHPQSKQCVVASARDEIFRLGSTIGRMSSAFLTVPYDGNPDQAFGEDIAVLLGEVFIHMCRICEVCGIDLRSSVLKKIELNGRKYPVELCKGKSGKYTKYSQHTGITKTEGQSTVDKDVNNISFESTTSENSETIEETDTATIEGVTLLLRQFAKDRLWDKYHTPRNIALAIMGEFGELAELFQFRGDKSIDEARPDNQSAGLIDIDWSAEEVDKVGQEIADVTIYLMRLADVCGVPLGEVSLRVIG